MHGDKTVTTLGELRSGVKGYPVTSAELVWDYSRIDTATNLPKTLEQVNTDLYTIAEGKADKSELTEAIDAINESIATLPGSFDVYSANVGDTIPEGATLTWDGAPVETRIAEVNETKTLMVACARTNENNADWPNPKQVRLSTFVLGHSLVATSAANGAKPFNGFQDEDITVAEVGYNGTPQEIYFNTVRGCFIGKTGNAIQGYTYYNSWTNDADYRNNAASNVFVYANGQVASYYRYVENGGYVMGNITNFNELSADLKEVWGGAQVDKAYNPLTYSGLGKKTLLKNIVSNVNTLTQAMMPVATVEGQEDPGRNTIYIIQYDYDLGGQTIKIPSGSILLFEGGSLSNGTIVGNYSTIIGGYKIFDNIEVSGSWACNGNVGWWVKGCEWNERTKQPIPNDETEALQQALDSSFLVMEFPPRAYYITSTLNINTPKDLLLSGEGWRASLSYPSYGRPKNRTVVWTDKDITMLYIHPRANFASKYDDSAPVHIKGGVFDCSRYEEITGNAYSKNAVEIVGGRGGYVWDLHLETSIIGYRDASSHQHGVGVYITTDVNTDELKGHATNVWINSLIAYFEKGVVVEKDATADASGAWMTDVNIGGYIHSCRQAIITDANGMITSVIQTSRFASTLEESKQYPLVVLNGGFFDIQGMFWDLRGTYGTAPNVTYSNYYGLHISDDVKLVSITGETSLLKENDYRLISGNKFAIKDYRLYSVVTNNQHSRTTNDFVANPLCDYFLGISKKPGITIDIKHYNSSGVEKSGSISVSNIDNMFKYDESVTTINISEEIEDDDYVDIKINFPSLPTNLRARIKGLELVAKNYYTGSVYRCPITSSKFVGEYNGGIKDDVFGIIDTIERDFRLLYRLDNSITYYSATYRLYGIKTNKLEIYQALCFNYLCDKGINILTSAGGISYGDITLANNVGGGVSLRNGVLGLPSSYFNAVNILPRRVINADTDGGYVGYYPAFEIDLYTDRCRQSYIIDLIGNNNHRATYKIAMSGNAQRNSTNTIKSFYIERLDGNLQVECQIWRKIVRDSNDLVIDQKAIIAFCLSESEKKGAFATVLNPDDRIYIPNLSAIGVPTGYEVMVSGVGGVSVVNIKHIGTSTERDAMLLESSNVGMQFFDTSLKKPVYAAEISADGLATWVDVTGTAVSYMVRYKLTGVHLIEDKKSATASINYSTTIEEDEGYALPSGITVKVNGVSLIPGTHYNYDSETGLIVILSTSVNGAIIIEATGADPNAQGGGGQTPGPSV